MHEGMLSQKKTIICRLPQKLLQTKEQNNLTIHQVACFFSILHMLPLGQKLDYAIS
jgi:hypothetical protein